MINFQGKRLLASLNQPSGKTCTLAKFLGTEWSLMDSQWSAQLLKNTNIEGHFFELMGHGMVRFFPRRKLEHEPKHCEKRRSEHDFVTPVEFSAEDPYGQAVALLDLKSGIFKVQEDLLVIPGIILGFIFSETLRKEGYNGQISTGENPKEKDVLIQEVSERHEEELKTDFITAVEGSEC